MITLKKINEILLLTGLFFFSFNDFEGIPVLGEFKKEAGVYNELAVKQFEGQVFNSKSFELNILQLIQIMRLVLCLFRKKFQQNQEL